MSKRVASTPIMQSDIAKALGISQATVSRVLANKNGIKEDTRKRVLEAARHMGFQTNAHARALVSGRTHTVGVAIRELSYLSALCISTTMRGITEVCDENHQGTLFCSSGPAVSGPSEYVRIAQEGRVDGMVVIDQLAMRKDLAVFQSMGLPLVLVDDRSARNDFPTVRIDYRAILREATQYLIDLGHRRIAVATDRIDDKLFMYREMLAGYRQAFKDNDIPLDPRLLPDANMVGVDYPSLAPHLDRILGLEDPPTAFVCMQEALNFPLYYGLTRRGLMVPRDISIMGFGSTALNSATTCMFTFIRIPGVEAGRRACQLLLDLVGGDVSTKEIVLEADLQMGESCQPLPFARVKS